jgi:hypothetical protein
LSSARSTAQRTSFNGTPRSVDISMLIEVLPRMLGSRISALT